MPLQVQDLEQVLKHSFENSEIIIKDLVGDQNHYQVTITSEKFNGLNKLAQHRLVMSALKEKLKEELHAVQIITKTTS